MNLEIGNIAPPMDNNVALRRILQLLAASPESSSYTTDDGDLIAHVFSISASGDNEIVSAVANKSIRVHQLFLETAGDTNLTVKSGTNPISHAISLISGDKIILDPHKTPWFKTAKGDALNFSLSSGVAVTGIIYYSQI